jgi:hypothetical protein
MTWPTAAAVRDRPASATVLRPVWGGGSPVVAPVIAAFLPADIAAVVVAANGGNAVLALFAVGLTLCAGLKLLWLFSQTRLQLDPGVVTEYGLFRSRRATAQRVASAALVTVYDEGSLQPRPQLFLLDEAGRTLLRMRGRYWSDDQMRAVAAHFDVPVSETLEPVTRRELRMQHGPRLTWTERHNLASTVLLVSAGVATCAVISVLATLLLR